MRRPGHPSMRKLHRWIDDEDETLDRHLATCDYCTRRLEPLLEDGDLRIGSALLTLLAVPDELPSRLQVGIDSRLSNQSDMSLIGELFGVPFRTVRAITTPQGDH